MWFKGNSAFLWICEKSCLRARQLNIEGGGRGGISLNFFQSRGRENVRIIRVILNGPLSGKKNKFSR